MEVNKITCEICNKEFETFTGRLKHMKNKHETSASEIKKEKKIDNCVCTLCGKKLASQSSKCRHEKKCKGNEMYQDLLKQIADLKKDFQEFKEAKDKEENKPKITTNNTNCNNTNVFQFVIQPYYQIAPNMYTEEEKKMLIETGWKCPETFAEYTFFNPDKPEWQSIKKTTKEDKVKIYHHAENKFIIKEKEDIKNNILYYTHKCLSNMIENVNVINGLDETTLEEAKKAVKCIREVKEEQLDLLDTEEREKIKKKRRRVGKKIDDLIDKTNK
jgi:hypothetical protein